uniref:Uncharacterized protein n=1 Tax=Cucumis melo TaxID=3656 RepID=A0A9I9EDR7_CUCME
MELFSGGWLGLFASSYWKWSLGAIMYEMLVDCPPFYSDDPITSCRKIVHWKNHLKFPEDAKLIIEAKDLICRLYWRSIPNQSIHYNNQAFTATYRNTEFVSGPSMLDPSIPGKRGSGPSTKMLLIPKDLSFVGYTFKNFDAVKGIKGRNSIIQAHDKNRTLFYGCLTTGALLLASFLLEQELANHPFFTIVVIK